MRDQNESGSTESEILWLKALGMTINSERFKLRLTQAELSLRSGINRTYLSDVEAGKRRVKVITLNLLARALGLSASSLLELVEEQFAASLAANDGEPLQKNDIVSSADKDICESARPALARKNAITFTSDNAGDEVDEQN